MAQDTVILIRAISITRAIGRGGPAETHVLKITNVPVFLYGAWT
jgi:hypothetical protein